MSVYKPCDIRGTTDQLKPELYRSWGRCIGRRVGRKAVTIGGDVRTHTPGFLNALEQGLLDTDAQVCNLGIVPTPIVYFASRQSGSGACAIVTASHNPPHYNGLKWMIDNRPPSQEQVEQFRDETDTDSPGPVDVTRSTVTPRHDAKIETAYVSWLTERFGRPIEGMHVIVDPGCGCWSGGAGQYLRRVFPGLRVTAIHDEPDGTFPKRNPDSAQPKHLKALCEAVRVHDADLGLAFDGDGDRVAYVDHTGHPLSAEQATFALLMALGNDLESQSFVYDIKFSDKIAEAASGYGAETIPQRSGHAFIRQAMQRMNGLLGAEISGHFFYGELDGSDDGLFSAMLLLASLHQRGDRLSERRAVCPEIYMTPDLRLTLDADACSAALDWAKRAFAQRPRREIDGVRIDFEDGWALLRQSVTEPALTFRFEGNDPRALNHVVEQFCVSMGEVGSALLDRYQSSHAALPNF